MLELAVCLGGHTHPRSLADAFLRRLRMLCQAQETQLVLRRGDAEQGEVESVEVFANSLDLRARNGADTAADQCFELPGLGHLRAIKPQQPLQHEDLELVLQAFARAFVACTENERENRQLFNDVERSELAAANRVRLVDEAGEEMLQLVDEMFERLERLTHAENADAGETASRALQQAGLHLRELIRKRLLDPLRNALPEPDVSSEASPVSARSEQLTSPRVLLVEDFAPMRELLSLQLEALGCQVDAAGDGAEALRLWLTERHDLVFTDLNMPVMDGVELTRALRFHQQPGERRLPIVGVTAVSEPSELERCRGAGMSEILIKPVDLPTIERSLHRWNRGSFAVVAAEPDSDDIGNDYVLDLEQIYRILGEIDRAEALSIVDVFIESAGRGLHRLAEVDDPRPLLAAEMHQQKSAARNIGAQHFAELAESLEARVKREPEAIDAALEIARMQAALGEVVTRADRWKASRKPIASGDHGAPSAPVGLVPRSALIADDDPVTQLQLKMLLKGFGVADIYSAGNGHEARAVLKRIGGQVDLLFCDLNMPDMDGVELLRALGRHRYRGALALLTGEDNAVLQTVTKLATLHGLRVVGQLGKPVMRGELSQCLEQAMGSGPSVSAVQQQLQIAPQAILKGIARSEFQIHFQPQVDTHTLQPMGVEALARWRRSDGDFVPPAVFIHAAESMELIGQLSELLLQRALSEGARLHKAGFPLRISVNVSAVWLNTLELPDQILAITRQSGLEPSQVVIEITETGLTSDVTIALDVLTRLRLRGFGLSIDDFGIGYSSFEQLRRFPFSELKLDRSFVSNSNRDQASRAILESTMKIAARLKLDTIAEGVEVSSDLELVRRLGCPRAQGYFIARPMPTEDLLTWLRERPDMH